MKKIIAVMLTLALALSALCPALAESEDAAAADARYVRITVRDCGEMYAELYPDIAPITVENFLKLVNSGFYDGLTFHRIIKGFMIQGGDPLGNGTGGSKDTIQGEFSANGVENPLKHERGVLSMARSSNKNSASSQFFIMHAAASHLDGNYAAFGRVLSGMWIVDRLCLLTPTQDTNGTVAREDQPVIESIREVTQQEALAARAKESANGQPGGTYTDLMTGLSFPVPQGWRLVQDQNARVVFSAESDPQKRLIVQRSDYWGGISASGKQQLLDMGYSRDALNTDAFKLSSLAGMLGLQEADLAPETFSGLRFYCSEQPAGENGAVVYMVGAHRGVIYLLAFTGAKTDPLYLDVLTMLDNISFTK